MGSSRWWAVRLALVVTAVLFAFGDAAGAAATSAGNGQGGPPGENAHHSIVGGTPTSIVSYPWIAHVHYRGPVEDFECGGTVVAPRLILTAAHCVLTGTGRVATAANFSVLTGVGDLDQATPANSSQASRVLVFPEYEPSRFLNDAALLVLAEPVAVPALPLATSADGALIADGAPVAVAGWGLVDVSPPQLPTALRDAQSVVRSPSYCQRSLRRVLPVFASESQICVKSPPGPGGASLCNGDSGGPGIGRRPDGTVVQIGIISLKGSVDCNPASPQVLARVDRVSPWVAAWAAAVEFGAPAPAVVVPKVELPPLTRIDAEIIAWLGLENDFGSRFLGGRYHQIECRRINREKARCRVQWLKGANFYRGGITVFAALPREGFVYNYRYTIRRFNANCWLEYLHPIQACNPRLFKR
jgi:trypsin